MSYFQTCGPKIKQKGAAGCIATCNLKPRSLQGNLRGNLQSDHQHGLAKRTIREYMRQGTHIKRAALKQKMRTTSVNTDCRTAEINVRRARTTPRPTRIALVDFSGRASTRERQISLHRKGFTFRHVYAKGLMVSMCTAMAIHESYKFLKQTTNKEKPTLLQVAACWIPDFWRTRSVYR